MAQWRLITSSVVVCCVMTFKFVMGITKRLASKLLALTGWEAQASAMCRGSSSARNINRANGQARAYSIHSIVLCLIGIGGFQPVIVVFAAERCVAPAATRVVSVQGNVTWSVVGSAALEPAKLNDLLCVGDTVRVGAKSRAVLRLPNETTIPLDQNTIFQLKQAISEKEPTLIELIQGAIHVITRTPKPFKVNTPYMNAAVEGTEFYVGVDSEEARVAVIEGKVNVSNEQGVLLLTDNEAATAKKGQAPQKTLTIKPRDAVQWALYYPPLFDPRSRTGGQNLAASYELYSQGKITDAIESLEAIPEVERNADYRSYRAGLLLLVGRADEAEPDIEWALSENANNPDALSLKAIIAIVRNDKDKALALANQAVSFDERSATARIALSYALQANFKIEEALKSAREASERDTSNALAWARVAELELSIPNYDKSKDAGENAVKLNPNLARTQSILGFASLTRIDIAAAKKSFNRAIELDQADPLPRLGLGLAAIREGRLQDGREHIEIASGLDPENSLIRSYLGKAYYEEGRDSIAGRQLDLAKDRDPKDPTPYFYDAIRKQTKNLPVEALQDLQVSVERNENRAPYRSKLSLDRDVAAKSASRMRTFDDLGFEQLAQLEAVKSIVDDPSNSSAHRFLSDAFGHQGRQEIVRVSELLQAQLLQPLNSEPVPPQIGFRELALLTRDSPSRTGFNEYGTLFERDRIQAKVSGLVGNLATLGDELIFSGLSGRISFSIGQFHYETDGFRQNSDVRHDAVNAFVQLRASPSWDLQLELRRRKTENGDISFSGSPDVFSPGFRDSVEHDVARFGVHYSASPRSDVLVSFIHAKRQQDSIFPDLFGPDTHLIALGTVEGNQLEGQYIVQMERTKIIAGLGAFDASDRLAFRFEPEPCFFPSCDTKTKDRRQNAYALVNARLGEQIQLVSGLSFDDLKQGQLEVRRVNPKLGLMVTPSSRLSLRIAGFKSVKPALIADQTLEPSQILGFSQYSDDSNGSISRKVAAAIDAQISSSLKSGLEASRRRFSFALEQLTNPRFEEATENSFGTYLNWTPNNKTAVALSAFREELKLSVQDAIDGFTPSRVSTDSVTLGINLFWTSGFFCKFKVEHIRQNITNTTPILGEIENNRFTLAGIAFGYRLPNRRGVFTLEANNLFDKRFNYRDLSFLSSQPLNLRFVPERTITGRLSLYF